ncbi:MAG: hypothetical protein M1117_02965 [Candidatus Thermoplasmatota archaeon]|uniref:Uncharacterized protein n=2 Tax=Candidatus Sysuiplasma superficiale TaxID=2823368 RepID=A0A8J7YPI2_9ARCH|nr:hypothetical protein [Candidatus Sysuiplasma superficiale]MCL4346864.1 hypothetical protein [Candidatus Thermoplasmatota archaeon]
MAERHAIRHASADHCSVVDCKEIAVRSVSAKEAIAKAKMTVNEDAGGRAHLCKKHYREFKKATKTDRELERLAW